MRLQKAHIQLVMELNARIKVKDDAADGGNADDIVRLNPRLMEAAGSILRALTDALVNPVLCSTDPSHQIAR
jgi:hypothetical protein